MHRAVRLLLLSALALAALPCAAATAQPAGAQPAGSGLWQRLTGALPSEHAGAVVETRPTRFRAYALDRAALRRQLAAAPLEGTAPAGRQPIVSIAGPAGVERFRVVESPVMEPGLAASHPGIRTYAGRGVSNPASSVRFDLTPLGFHASVRTAHGTWYVDPYYRRDQSAYVAYWGRDLPDIHERVIQKPPVAPDSARALGTPAQKPGDAVVQRSYRLALISDPTYATYFGGAANVTAAKVTLINRVNQLYNDDLAVKLVLIDGNDALNLDTDAEFSSPGPQSPCTFPCYSPPATGDGCDPQTIQQNNVVADRIVGPTSYDIGHIILGKPGGGIAGLGVVGIPGDKASGCTGIPTPTGDYFAVDYVAHEMGHQFGGNHTFNGTQYNCSGGNRNEDTSVEPGSGSSVMAYAGICRQDDLQPHSDPYFSQRSIDEIQATVADDGNPATTNEGSEATTTNHSPVVTPAEARTIPIRTPFTLAGRATDADGDGLVFLWEQNDDESGDGTALVDNDKPDDGPLFRVFGLAADVPLEDALLYQSPGENHATAADAARTFPDQGQIAVGNTNAATGECPPVVLADPDDGTAPKGEPRPIRECYSEFLPTAPRTMNFRLTARDLHAGGGGVSAGDTAITVAGTKPFRVTSQGAPAGAAGNSALPVTWNVAGTNQAPFSVPNVRITYSTDGGLTFPTVLAESTPNDGSQSVTVPNTATTTGRIKVEAINNYFFDVSRADLTVTPVAVAAASSGTTSGASTPASKTAASTPAILSPDLRPLSRRLRASRTHRVKLRIACKTSGTASAPSRCRGVLRVFARVGGKRRVIARRAYDIGRTQTATVRVKLSRRAWRRIRTRSLLATVRATTIQPGVAPRSASKKTRLLARRRR
jgi:hypothetical protein